MSAESAPPKGTPANLQLVKCKLSASLIPGNLIANGKYYAYIHRNEVQLIDQRNVALGTDKSDTLKVAYGEKDVINQLEFLKVPTIGDILVVINQAGGVFIYDDGGQKLLHSYKHSKSSGSLTLKEQNLRGIAFDGKETLFIGQGSGELLVFQLTKSKFALVKSVSGVHTESSATSGGISALTYSVRDSTLVSGDDHGNIVFWSGVGPDVAAAKTVKVDGRGSPASLLTTGHGIVAAAFASGHIRLYDAARKEITVEIGAHTRAINGLDIHLTKPYLLAAGEDTYATVWQLPTPANPSVKHIMAETPVLGLLTGARFGGANQELIVTTTYDNRSLALMHTP